MGKDKKEYIKQIAQKDYCKQIVAEICEYERTLLQLFDIYEKDKLEKICEELHPSRKALVQPLFCSKADVIQEFEDANYIGKKFDENNTTEYYTIKGERVRSKSEKIIADELYRYGIPYKYEIPLELESWNRKILIYPDFTVLNRRTGRRWYLEHLGLMDNEAYYDNAMFKLDTYERNDILLGRDLLILHETSTAPLNTKVLEKVK